MDFERLKKEIKEIVSVAESVPEPLREKCFEILLNNLLGSANAGGKPKGQEEDLTPSADDLPIPTQLRVFMRRTKITQDDLKAILMICDDDVNFVRDPEPKSTVEGQKEWALLLALKNCILENSLSVDPEDVRSICQDKGFYDRANFATNFKNNKLAKLFKGVMERQGESRLLTKHGEDELAKIVRKLVDSQ